MKRSWPFALLLTAGLVLGVATGAETEAVPPEAGAFDWRAFLAPFHTVTLHMPIGFVTMAVILELYSFFPPSEALRRAIGVVLVFSALSAVVVVLLGICRASGGGYEPDTVGAHRNFGIAVGVVTLLVLIVHTAAFRPTAKRGRSGVYRSLLVADSILLVLAGHDGGNLTHGSKYLTANAPVWVQEWIMPEDCGDQEHHTDEGGVYAEVIQPVLEAKCYQCHGAEKQKADYRLNTVAGLFTPGESELDPIVKNRPMETLLVESITLPEDDEWAMPPEGKERLTPEETLAVIRGIWDGAKVEE